MGVLVVAFRPYKSGFVVRIVVIVRVRVFLKRTVVGD